MSRIARKKSVAWREAETHLSRVDPVLKRLIESVGSCTLSRRRGYFLALCQSIISQQISTAVAAAIFKRFRNLFPAARPTPRGVLALDETTLRGVGLSRQKAGYLRSLAAAFADGSVPVARLRHLTDEEIVQALIPIRGIGRWTAEMFLIFVLNRADLLPVDDLGLRNNLQNAYGLSSAPNAAAMMKIAECWRPYRSVATWYLWRGGGKTQAAKRAATVVKKSAVPKKQAIKRPKKIAADKRG